ncbi:unnamed protein product [Miscanthus lutarioriparius]|uniref:Gamma-glutamylcyclotransferase family protein n=1 Tax=Miscanthus lutarioriparius TaxID=422564 RepID=A0A811NF12_9POAL|nr:unnamed protein product [Miscanthus lutarioriparius]
MAEAKPTMVFVYGTLKRGFPNHPLLVASATPFVGAASTAGPASLVIGPYSVPFLLPTPSSASSGRVVSGELYAPCPAPPLSPSSTPSRQAPGLLIVPLSTALVSSPTPASQPPILSQGTHIGVYERRPITVVADGSGEAVQAEAYFAHPSYAEALRR